MYLRLDRKASALIVWSAEHKPVALLCPEKFVLNKYKNKHFAH